MASSSSAEGELGECAEGERGAVMGRGGRSRGRGRGGGRGGGGRGRGGAAAAGGGGAAAAEPMQVDGQGGGKARGRRGAAGEGGGVRARGRRGCRAHIGLLDALDAASWPLTSRRGCRHVGDTAAGSTGGRRCRRRTGMMIASGIGARGGATSFTRCTCARRRAGAAEGDARRSAPTPWRRVRGRRRHVGAPKRRVSRGA